MNRKIKIPIAIILAILIWSIGFFIVMNSKTVSAIDNNLASQVSTSTNIEPWSHICIRSCMQRYLRDLLRCNPSDIVCVEAAIINYEYCISDCMQPDRPMPS